MGKGLSCHWSDPGNLCIFVIMNAKDSKKLVRALKRAEQTLFERLRSEFLTGVAVTVPIVLTLYIAWKFLIFVDTLVTPLIPPQYNPNNYLPFSIPGVGLVIAVVFFTLVGWMTQNYLGGLLVRISDAIVNRVPIIGSVYRSIKQIFETLVNGYASAFKEVVMLEFPSPGSWTIGFVTGVMKETQIDPANELVSVLVPTALNPTGFLMFVPRKNLRPISLSVEHAIKLILSGGLMPPEDQAKAQKV